VCGADLPEELPERYGHAEDAGRPDDKEQEGRDGKAGDTEAGGSK